MTPAPSLRYSSAGALRGGLAVGWTLELSMPPIERDPYDSASGPAYASGGSRLVSVPDHARFGGATYRAEIDDASVRYEYVHPPNGVWVPGFGGASSGWIARTPSGVTAYFASVEGASDTFTLWHLTRQEDLHGNYIEYTWEETDHGGYQAYSLAQISYGANDGAGLEHHARVTFEYTTDACAGSAVPPGAAIDRRFGRTIARGARRLTAVRTEVLDEGDWRSVRTLDLGYDQDALTCPVQLLRAPLRYLMSVTATGYDRNGAATTAPTTTFGYGPEQANFDNQVGHGTTGFAERGAPGGTTGRLLDIDGDGLLDWVHIRQDWVGNVVECRLGVNWGRPGGGYWIKEMKLSLPTASWQNGVSPTHDERCTLDGQFVRSSGVVTNNKDSCIYPVGSFISYHFIDYDSDGRVDLLTNAWTDGYYDPAEDFGAAPVPIPTSSNDDGPELGQCPEGTVETGVTSETNGWETTNTHHCGCPGGQHLESNGFVFYCCDDNTTGTSLPGGGFECSQTGGGPGDGMPDEDFPGNAPPNCTSGPPRSPEVVPGHESSHDMHPYVWRVYRNTGGSFHGVSYDPTGTNVAEPPMFVLSPRPLPPAVPPTPTSIVDPVTAAVGLQTLIDIDGDGFLDVVVPNGTVKKPWPLGHDDGSGARLLVWRGHGGREFDDEESWAFPVAFVPKIGPYGPYEAGGTRHSLSAVAASFVDLNGDGLPDLVVNLESMKPAPAGIIRDHLHAFWNTGSGFSAPEDLGLRGPVDLVQTDDLNNTDLAANRGTLHGFVDVDGDGLLDRIRFLVPLDDVTDADLPRVFLNLGDRFRSQPAVLAGVWKSAQSIRHAVANGDWHLESGFADHDGDGAPDLVRWLGAGLMTTFSHDRSAGAPRLLREVRNGFGGVVSFEYAPSTDPDVVTMDTLAYNPSPRWVVRSMTTAGGFGQPEVTTSYRYGNAVYGAPSERADDQFLGFERVEIENPSPDGMRPGSLVVRELDYDLPDDHRGQVVTERTYGGLGLPRKLETYTTNKWKVQPLFDGLVVSTQLSETITRTCAPGMSESACMGQTSDLYRRTETWRPFRPNGQESEPGAEDAVLCLQTLVEEGTSLLPSDGDRRESHEYLLHYGDSQPSSTDQYLVLPRQLERQAASGDGGSASWEVTGREETVFNTRGLPIESHVWMDHDIVATTVRTFDGVGNLRSIARPRQVHASPTPAAVQLDYDAQRLFASETVNELGHTSFDTRDLGTGALISSQGPNLAASLPPGCSILGDWWQCAQVAYEGEAWVRDGLGRVIEHHVSFDDPKTGYTPVLVTKTLYEDANLQNGTPNVAREQHLLDRETNKWTESVTETDGLGRPIRHVERRKIAGKPDAVKEYQYDSAGNLAEMRAPDPRWDTGAQVTFRYEHDGNGRVVTFEPPTSVQESVSYPGRDCLVTVAGTDGTGSTTKYFYDPYGRLSRVDEYPSREDGGPVATTSYEYDDRDRLRKIVNADGDTTSMEHDWVGHRTHVRRGSRTWTYDYDRDGNLTAKRPPVPEGADPEQYRTSFEYDVLDRVEISKPPGMGRPAQRAKELGIGPIEYYYDEGTNGLGRLSRVELPWGEIGYEYEARGLPTEESRSFQVDTLAPASASQSVSYAYDALGQPTQVEADDGTRWRFHRDARALVDRVEWYRAERKEWSLVAGYERSLAGQPRARATDFDQRRVWSYDAVGRVTSDLIYRVPWLLRSQLEYTYWDAGDVRTVSGEIDRMSTELEYRYDGRHRLLGAKGPRGAYGGDFTYTPAGNLKSARVRGSGEAFARNVTYEYGLVDPQAVDVLRNAADGTPLAEIGYDAAGNATNRVSPDGAWSFTWDGDDQLSEAVGPEGREIYYYDHNGTRTLAISESGVRFWLGPSETHFDASGHQLRRWLHIGDGSGPVARVENGTEIELQYVDPLENLILALSAKASPVASFVYGPFGEVLASKGASEHRRQFNSKESDRLTGLRYYGARYYDPVALRWIAADPLLRFAPDVELTNPQHHNLYSFSLNNPLRYFDPTGLRPVEDGNSPGLVVHDACRANGGCTPEQRRQMTNDLRAGQNKAAKLAGKAFGILVCDSAKDCAFLAGTILVGGGVGLLVKSYMKARKARKMIKTAEEVEKLTDDFAKCMWGACGAAEARSATGRVATRINVSNEGFEHVVKTHLNVAKAGTKSQFTISQTELRELLQAKNTVRTPAFKLSDSGNFARTVTVDRVVGSAIGAGPTKTLTIITDKFGNLQTAFPGRL